MAAKMLEKLHELHSKSIGYLLRKASEMGIISEQEIEQAFKALKRRGQSSRRILDKFIHGDIVWMVDFIRAGEDDTSVVGAKNVFEEFKVVADMCVDQFAIEVLKAMCRIAGVLYFGARLEENCSFSS